MCAQSMKYDDVIDKAHVGVCPLRAIGIMKSETLAAKSAPASGQYVACLYAPDPVQKGDLRGAVSFLLAFFFCVCSLGVILSIII